MSLKGERTCCYQKTSIRFGRFKRRSDGKWIQRYRCKDCHKTYSQATGDAAYNQKKRHLNYKCLLLISSNISMRRIALILGIHPITVARKLEFLAQQSRQKLNQDLHHYAPITGIQFDELQTIEHTKCKPLSVAMVVAEKSRKILGFQVSIMPATGYLATISRQKYGQRPDNRKKGLDTLFKQLIDTLGPKINIRSDECVYYKPVIKKYFPKANYNQFKGEKSCISGQGELKKSVRDPLFLINHTFAMLRANINRLIRRTWCTTKKISRLIDHLSVYCWFHNSRLTKNA